MLALHDHGGFRWLGKEKIADGGPEPHPHLLGARGDYDGIAWANELARAGFCVLVHDVLSWGSRQFSCDDLQHGEGQWHHGAFPSEKSVIIPEQIQHYNKVANEREHTLAKWCTLLGCTIPGLLLYEDRIAAALLQQQPECRDSSLQCVGHSGGGARACLLATLEPRINGSVVCSAMTSYRDLRRHRTWLHT